MPASWDTCEAVLRCMDEGRLRVEVRADSIKPCLHVTSGACLHSACATLSDLSVTLSRVCLFLMCAQLSDEHTSSQLAWWRRVLTVAPTLRLRFEHHGRRKERQLRAHPHHGCSLTLPRIQLLSDCLSPPSLLSVSISYALQAIATCLELFWIARSSCTGGATKCHCRPWLTLNFT
jgi:hypothetical protein